MIKILKYIIKKKRITTPPSNQNLNFKNKINVHSNNNILDEKILKFIIQIACINIQSKKNMRNSFNFNNLNENNYIIEGSKS